MADNNPGTMRQSFDRLFDINQRESANTMSVTAQYVILSGLTFWLLINICSIVIGIVYIHSCPANNSIPIVLIVMGTTACAAIISTIFYKKINKFVLAKAFIKIFYIGKTFFVAFEAGVIFSIPKPAFNSEYTKYCHPLLYYYVFYHEVLIIAAIALFIIIVLVSVDVSRLDNTSSNSQSENAMEMSSVNPIG